MAVVYACGWHSTGRAYVPLITDPLACESPITHAPCMTHQHAVWNLEVQHLVNTLCPPGEHLIQLLRLNDRAWEAVQDEAPAAL